MDAEVQDAAVTKINALSIDIQAKYDMFEQFEEDCERFGTATAQEKLATAINDLETDVVPA